MAFSPKKKSYRSICFSCSYSGDEPPYYFGCITVCRAPFAFYNSPLYHTWYSSFFFYVFYRSPSSCRSCRKCRRTSSPASATRRRWEPAPPRPQAAATATTAPPARSALPPSLRSPASPEAQQEALPIRTLTATMLRGLHGGVRLSRATDRLCAGVTSAGRKTAVSVVVGRGLLCPAEGVLVVPVAAGGGGGGADRGGGGGGGGCVRVSGVV